MTHPHHQTYETLRAQARALEDADPERAEALYDDVLREAPRHYPALLDRAVLRARVGLARGRDEVVWAALDDLKAALEAAPDAQRERARGAFWSAVGPEALRVSLEARAMAEDVERRVSKLTDRTLGAALIERPAPQTPQTPEGALGRAAGTGARREPSHADRLHALEQRLERVEALLGDTDSSIDARLTQAVRDLDTADAHTDRAVAALSARLDRVGYLDAGPPLEALAIDPLDVEALSPHDRDVRVAVARLRDTLQALLDTLGS